MKRLLALALLAAIAVVALWLYNRSSAPPEVAVSPATRETIISLLSTNGKVEPAEWRAVTADREGRITQVHVQIGQRVTAGAPLVTFSAPGAAAEIAAAASRLESAKAALATVERGGASRELAEIDGTLGTQRLERESAAREVESLRKLVEKKAATMLELYNAQDRLRRLDANIATQTKRRAALVDRDDRAVAEARVRDAEQALALVKRNAADSVVRAPIAGEVYELTARPGSWVSPGTVLARVGRIDELRVVILVDEPDLGRVHEGQTVKVTWDAMPGRSWKAKVKSVPTQVVAHESRQVGEVVAQAENPDATLPPGANINVEIVAQVAENAITIPKQALRREGAEMGVFVLRGDKLEWLRLETGISSVDRIEVHGNSLKEKDLLATDAAVPLTNGMAVRSVIH